MDNIYLDSDNLKAAFQPTKDFYFFPELLQVEKKLEDLLSGSTETVMKICKNLLTAGGKRLRPLLACLSGRIFGIEGEDLINCATSLELIHMASLIHDDIIDEAGTRRGKPSVNSVWGNQIAVLTGDFLFAKAFELLSPSHLSPVLTVITMAIDAMCQGEIEQALAKKDLEQTVQQYFNRIEKKTGRLIIASCSIGPLLAEGEPTKLFSLQNYGLNLGYAFQIIDDLFDLKGSSKLIGKPTNIDLDQGYLTLPVLQLLADPLYKNEAETILSKLPLSLNNRLRLQQLMTSSGVFDKSYNQAREFIKQAKSQLEAFAPSPPVTALLSLADSLLERNL